MKLTYKTVKNIGRVMCASVQLYVTGKEHVKPGSGLVIANHPHGLEEILMIGAQFQERLAYMANQQFFDKLWVGSRVETYFSEHLGVKSGILVDKIVKAAADLVNDSISEMDVVPVKMSGAKREGDIGISNFKKAIRYVGGGQKLVIFPEGRKTLSEKLKPFNPGLGALAYSLHIRGHDVPVYPVRVVGFSKLTKLRILTRPLLKIHFGEPLYIKDYMNETRKETINLFVDVLYDTMRSM